MVSAFDHCLFRSEHKCHFSSHLSSETNDDLESFSRISFIFSLGIAERLRSPKRCSRTSTNPFTVLATWNRCTSRNMGGKWETHETVALTAAISQLLLWITVYSEQQQKVKPNTTFTTVFREGNVYQKLSRKDINAYNIDRKTLITRMLQCIAFSTVVIREVSWFITSYGTQKNENRLLPIPVWSAPRSLLPRDLEVAIWMCEDWESSFSA